DSGVCRGAAEILGEARHVLEPAADLLAVEIDGGSPHRDQLEAALSGCGHSCLRCGPPAGDRATRRWIAPDIWAPRASGMAGSEPRRGRRRPTRTWCRDRSDCR